MSDYTFEVQHSPETIMQMSRTQYTAAQGKRRVVQVAVAAVCLLFGSRLIGNIAEPFNYLFSLYGCFSLIFINLPAKSRAEKIIRHIQSSGGRFPCSIFDFSEKGFHVTAKGVKGPGETHAYKDCCRLLEHQDSYYYFLNKDAAFMFPKSCLPAGKADAFKTYLENKTGLPCPPLNRWWNASIWSLLRTHKGIRK